MVKTPHFHCRAAGSIPDQRTNIPVLLKLDLKIQFNLKDRRSCLPLCFHFLFPKGAFEDNWTPTGKLICPIQLMSSLLFPQHNNQDDQAQDVCSVPAVHQVLGQTCLIYVISELGITIPMVHRRHLRLRETSEPIQGHRAIT